MWLFSYMKWDLDSASCKVCCYVNVVAVAAILRLCLRLKTFHIKAEVKIWARAVLLCPSSLSAVAFLYIFFQVMHWISVIKNIWILYFVYMNLLLPLAPSFVSSWLISKSSVIFLYKSSFCTSNSWPVFCFALSSVLILRQLGLGDVYQIGIRRCLQWNIVMDNAIGGWG